MNEERKKRLRIALSWKQQVLLGAAILVLVGLLGYGWYYWKGLKTSKTSPKSGLNTVLPDAKLEQKDPLDKMAYYEQAKRDSLKADTSKLAFAAEKLGFGSSGAGGSNAELQERKINEKLLAINQAIAAPSPVQAVGAGVNLPKYPVSNNAPLSKDVDRLELLMKGMSSAKESDPELEQLGAMMDKLLVLQNPELAGRMLKKEAVSVLPDSVFRAVPAEVVGKQKVKQGTVVELRLLDSLLISGQVIPAGHLVYGLAAFSNQRISLEIKNIRLGTSIVPVNLTVFDRRDGMVGINAPEALVRDAVSGGISSGVSGIGISRFDLGSQLAGAGIDAARSLLNKKVSRLRQTLVAGYPLLLRDNLRKGKP
ncbi:conjugative transposon protein TraM [Pedobacter paludis]|uniref:Conjugal transfer protein TraM n=1 Tax=Pedobacter paludis TaxID=2203212 RepID=A0A317F2C9_9SPHI|nr:conjugative transposon protein TraM [Pedobacter paludis]PWS33324.1 conjugal transfer protein TraM [Pedobacter paludis]